MFRVYDLFRVFVFFGFFLGGSFSSSFLFLSFCLMSVSLLTFESSRPFSSLFPFEQQQHQLNAFAFQKGFERQKKTKTKTKKKKKKKKKT